MSGRARLGAPRDQRGRFVNWSRFVALRDALDPGRTFSNRFLERVLGG